LRFEGMLPAQLRELAILTVAAEWQAHFEWWAHERIARDIGLDETTIAGVLKKLNLQDQPHITHGYASMMRHNLKQAGIQKKEIFLEQ